MSGGRQLVVCCDGTSNTLTGGQGDTNVVRVVHMLREMGQREPQRPDEPEQLVYYDPGVGAPDGLPPTGPLGFFTEPIKRALALSVGSGIYDNIGQAYLFLCREYGRHAPSGATATTDEIYLFGFSRGAFTVRAVAGMVNMFGLIAPEQEQLLPTLLSVYFTPRSRKQGMTVEALEGVRRASLGGKPQLDRMAIADQVRRTFTTPIGAQAQVHFVGVWDTVQSVGVPGLRRSITNRSTIRGKRFTHARQLLSLDEHRRQFLPRPYADDAVDPDQSLRQLWVRGVHGDVGGSKNRYVNVSADRDHPDWEWQVSPLSEVCFRWMVDEAAEVGLRNVAPATDRSSGVRAVPATETRITDQLYAKPWWALIGTVLREPPLGPSGNVPLERVDGELVARIGAAPAPGATPTAADPTDVPYEQRPVEHPSVAAFTAYGPADVPLGGGVVLPGVTVRSPWLQGWRSIRWRALATSLVGLGLLALLVWQSGAAPWPTAEFGDGPTAADLAVRAAGLALALYVLSVVATRAYSVRLQWRRASDRRPWAEALAERPRGEVRPPGMSAVVATVLRRLPLPLAVSPLGSGVSLVFLGGAGSLLLHAVALLIGWAPISDLLQAAAGTLVLVEWLGLALVAVLLAFGGLAELRRPTRRAPAATPGGST